MVDEQNFIEKIGIIRDIGDIKLQLEKLRGEVRSLTDIKNEAHREMTADTRKLEQEIYGNGHAGLKTITDRLNQVKQNRRVHLMLIYGALASIIVDLVANWLNKKP